MLNKFNVECAFDAELKKLNNKYKGNEDLAEILKRGLRSSTDIPTNAVLFIGINPSYQENAIESNNDLEGKVSYHAIQQEENDYQKFFNVFSKMAGAQGFNHIWAHIDLLYFRETNQKWISDLIRDKKEPVSKSATAFVKDQLEISKKILAESQPKVIVIANTLARDYFGNYEAGNKESAPSLSMGFDLKFDDDLGTYLITTDGPLFDVPVFITGMLSGQRALDRGSRQRLAWHVKYVLNKIQAKVAQSI